MTKFFLWRCAGVCILLLALYGGATAVFAQETVPAAPRGGTVPPFSGFLPLISNPPPPTPILVTDLTSGSGHNCVRRPEGNVLCWGNNDYRALGLGNIGNLPLPMQIGELNNIDSVTAGFSRTCAVSSPAGELYCWGFNNDRVIADDAVEFKPRPVLISGLGGKVIQVAVGSRVTCVLLEGGTVKCWGTTILYEDGVGYEYIDSIPGEVEGLEGEVTAISMMGLHACAIMIDRTVRCWGNNDDGELGNGTQDDSYDAVQVQGLSDIVQISAGGGFTCARSSSGAVYCWGRNTYGELGDGTTDPFRTLPAPVPALSSGVIDIDISVHEACAVLTSGVVRCWGRNENGEVGNGTTVSTRVPSQVTGLTDARLVSTGAFHTCATTVSGPVYCWGHNIQGALGTGNFVNSLVPVRVVGLGGS